MIKNISTENLQAEIDRRQKVKEKRLIPKLIETPDIKPLQTICQNYTNELIKNGYVRDDLEHYIFETAMETVFGKNVWQFINSFDGEV